MRPRPPLPPGETESRPDDLITKTFDAMTVRIVTVDSQPWFVAADVGRALGFKGAGQQTNNYTRHLDANEKQNVRNPVTHTAGMGQYAYRFTVISESGLYKLVMRSDKPAARRFQDWVTRDVLPAIRKDGGYIQGEEKVATGEMGEDELIAKAMQIMAGKIERLRYGATD